MFAEQYARLLLVAHTLAAAALVALSTHLVVWTRGYLRGRFHRHAAVKRFAQWSLVLYVFTFAIGNVIYPIYKVNVRVQYLDDPSALADDYTAREDARIRATPNPATNTLNSDDTRARPANTHVRPAMNVPAMSVRAAKIARWFDVKEHWVALGLAMSFACALILRRYNPAKHGATIAPIVFALALGQAAATWFGAIVGIVTSSYRSIGGLG